MEEQDFQQKKDDLQKLQEQVKKDQDDIAQQRETLYRKLEALKNQGIVLSSNMAMVPGMTSVSDDDAKSPPPVEIIINPKLHSSVSDSKLLNATRANDDSSLTTSSGRRREGRRSQTLPGGPKQPSHLLSATIQQKAAADQVPIKQQIPLKLAKLGSLSQTSPTPSATSPNIQQNVSPNVQQKQQILPFKLLEDPKGTPKASFGYQKLSSVSASNIHNRSGSNPLSMTSPKPPAKPKTDDQCTGGGGPASQIGQTYKTYPGGALSNSKPVRGGSLTQPKPNKPDTDQEIIFF